MDCALFLPKYLRLFRAFRAPSVRRGRQLGLTLLEVLIAMSIMAFSFAILYRAMGGSVRAVGIASDTTRASVLARSLQARHAWLPEGGWNEQGESAGMRWAVASERIPMEKEKDTLPPMYRVEFDISWLDSGKEKHLRWSSMLPQKKRIPGEELH